MTRILSINCVSGLCLWKTGNFPDSSGPRLWKHCCCCILSPSEESRWAFPLPRAPESRCRRSVGVPPAAPVSRMLPPAGLGELQSCWCPPSWVAMAGKAGTASPGQSWGWHRGGTAMPWIRRESPQPLAEGPAGIPAGDHSKSQEGERCCLAGTAPSSTQ